jgi:hypothetical protein
MKLSELMIITGADEEVRFYNDGRELCFQFALKGCSTTEKMVGGCVTCSWGGGKTKAAAKRDYCLEIQGKVFVVDHKFGHPDDNRMRFQLPSKISPI